MLVKNVKLRKTPETRTFDYYIASGKLLRKRKDLFMNYKIKDCETPKVSIILPIYNGEKYLEETLQAVHSSDYENWELICINDGSKDKSAEICKRYCEVDTRFIYYEQENAGVAYARNRGLSLATGEYICFLDQDDLVSTDMYSILIEDMEKHKCDIVVAGINYLNGNKFTRDKKIVVNEKCVDSKLQLKWLLIDENMCNTPCNKCPTTIWNVMFSATLIKKHQLFFKQFVAYEDDWVFLIEAIQFAKSIYFETKALYTWRIHQDNNTWRKKYIDEFASKRIALRNFVNEKLQMCDLTTDELYEYNLQYFVKNCFLSVNNEALMSVKKQSILEVRKAFEDGKKYLGNINLINCLKKVKKYGNKNLIIVILCYFRCFWLAIYVSKLFNLSFINTFGFLHKSEFTQ